MSGEPPDKGPADSLPPEWWLRVGHDLRGAVAPMRMAVQLLRSGRIALADRDDTLQLIDRQIDQLLAGIDDLSDLLRINAGTFASRLEQLDANLLLDVICGRSSLLRSLADKQQELRCVAAPSEMLVEHDPARVAALVEYLLRKLSEHSPPRSELLMELTAEAGVPVLRLSAANAAIASDPDLGFLLGDQRHAQSEPRLRTVLMREIARFNAIELFLDEAGRVTLRFLAAKDPANSPRSG